MPNYGNLTTRLHLTSSEKALEMARDVKERILAFDQVLEATSCRANEDELGEASEL
jgi:hypothetical protein